MMTEETALRHLRAAAQEAPGLAKRLDITQELLNLVMQGRVDPEYVLRRFGLRRIVRYEEIP